ncbi:LytR/AlgR family response regulator transcription factor [Marinicella litoralis]|uniref:LytTr DNA-binding domain-containing protein n=1 Tax=Marinicella litoralis TaxID=644220 RepID=A0A4V3DHC1_9GAMM|nr:LytTR family DNA-binding domain-containing protein [Marinicella litoralis]TDR17581.1 LytTr DNA-binding domain-containing protein [Marinicella litoralis]
MQIETKNISNKTFISITLLLCLTMIFFQTAQQMHYSSLYNIGDPNLGFDEVLFKQFRKWLLWLLYAGILWFQVKSMANKEQLSMLDISKTLAVIGLILVLVIGSMSMLEVVISGQKLLEGNNYQNYFISLVFQKLPIYFFGYSFLAFIMYLYCINNQLSVQVLKLSQLTKKDLSQYYQKTSNKDLETPVLKIKVGNSYKIISVDDIDWIEADDYCVNIHCINKEATYSMRSSLKALEGNLPENFLRVHRSAIVNMNNVQEFQTQGTGLVKLKSGDEVSVSKSKIKMINDFYHTGLA